jgi:protein-disulfide isomerase
MKPMERVPEAQGEGMTIRTTLVAAGLAALLLACESTPHEAQGASGSPVIGEVGGEAIHQAELDAYVKDKLFTIETRGGNVSRTYELRQRWLPRLLQERALERAAEERGTDVETLVRQEVERLGPVRDDEIDAFIAANAHQIADPEAEGLRESVAQHLAQQRAATAAQALVAEVGIDSMLPAPRVEVTTDGPSLGPEDAPVTIVEFSDFQCPYCQRAGPVVKAIAERYPDEVRVVYRHLPLDQIHSRARPAARAAVCADEQGHFWSYHDQLFASPGALAEEDLIRYASDLGADAEAFADCLASQRSAGKVARDVAEAQALGITGTPAFIINGIVLFGFQSEEALDAIVQQELANAS